MAISYTHEYEQLIIFDLQSDKENLDIVNRILHELAHDISRVKEFILSKKDRIDNLPDLLDKLMVVQNYKILLSDYSITHEVHSLMRHLEEYESSYDAIMSQNEKVLAFYERISSLRFLDSQLLRIIKKEGYDLFCKHLRELQHLANKPILRYLLELYDIYNNLLDLQENLENEKSKFEHKLLNGEQKILLKEIRQSRNNYSRDNVLLLKGLLQTDSNCYYTLKQQLDFQYNQIIQDKLLQLNKIVNFQGKVFMDERKIMGDLKDYRKKYLRLQRYVFC